MKYLYGLMILLAGCSSGGGGDNFPSPDPLSLDGLYRGSPVVVSANGFTYDYESPLSNPSLHYGTHGRVYTTTVNPDDTIDGTATLYKDASISTAALSGTINGSGALDLTFVDGSTRIDVAVQRIIEPQVILVGRSWCTIEADNATVHVCTEFDVLNNIQFITPTHGMQNVVSVSLGTEVETNVYEATLEWTHCTSATGLVSFATSEDGMHDEMAVTVVGSCGFVWWVILATR